MHSQQLKDRFIELRIEGKTLRGIADELKIAKSTACEWNIEMGNRIVEAQRIAMEAAMEELLAGPVSRAQNIALIYAKTHEKLMKEHESHPYSSIHFEPLLKLDSHLRKILPALPRTPRSPSDDAEKTKTPNPA